MILNILKQFNWVDVLVVIIVIRILYIATVKGFVIEIFKLLGVLLAVYLSLHYYTHFSDLLRKRVPLEDKLPLEFLDFICFALLAITGYLASVALRIGFYRLIKMDAAAGLQKWGGLFLGILRAWLFCGIIIFMLVISSISYLKKSVNSSYMGKMFFSVPVQTYTLLWEGLISKFTKNEGFNKTVLEVQGGMDK